MSSPQVAEASKRVWTSGCIEIVRSWAERNLYTIASVALGVALAQLFVIYLAKTLEGQIELQKARYDTINLRKKNKLQNSSNFIKKVGSIHFLALLKNVTITL